MIYRAEKEHCQQFPNPASPDLFAGVARNFQVFDPLDFLAEITQHIPNKGEHLIRNYGCYSNKSRAQRAKQAAPAQPAVPPLPSPAESAPGAPGAAGSAHLARRRWAMLIKRVYQADPLLCPKCGGTMNIIAFIEARQDDVIPKILQHCGLWEDQPSRAPPKPSPPSRAGRAVPERDSGFTCEVDPEFLEHARREKLDQPELPWES